MRSRALATAGARNATAHSKAATTQSHARQRGDPSSFFPSLPRKVRTDNSNAEFTYGAGISGVSLLGPYSNRNAILVVTFEHGGERAGQCRWPMVSIAVGHWSGPPMAAKIRSPLVEIDLRGHSNDGPSAGGQRFGHRSQPGRWLGHAFSRHPPRGWG